MLRFVIASLIAAAFVVATAFDPSAAATKKKHVERRPVVVAAAPAQPYGLPATYYPAPPFPFFILPGPWWLPAH